MLKTKPINHTGYCPGHPWYYLKGGAVPSLRAIQAAAIQSGYRGYLASDIDEINALSEPRRSEKLRASREKIRMELSADISRYREVACALRQQRSNHTNAPFQTFCDDIHTVISLKHNHIYNGFAHLHVIDGLLSMQPDLFG